MGCAYSSTSSSTPSLHPYPSRAPRFHSAGGTSGDKEHMQRLSLSDDVLLYLDIFDPSNNEFGDSLAPSSAKIWPSRSTAETDCSTSSPAGSSCSHELNPFVTLRRNPPLSHTRTSISILPQADGGEGLSCSHSTNVSGNASVLYVKLENDVTTTTTTTSNASSSSSTTTSTSSTSSTLTTTPTISTSHRENKIFWTDDCTPSVKPRDIPPLDLSLVTDVQPHMLHRAIEQPSTE